MPTGVYPNEFRRGLFLKELAPWNKGLKGVMPTPWNKGKKGSYSLISQGSFKRGHVPWNKGKFYLPDELHPTWKGDGVKYRGLHMWIQSKLGKPMFCEICKAKNLKFRQYHWANRSGRYLRNLSDWIRLCAKCHWAYDRNQIVLKFS